VKEVFQGRRLGFAPRTALAFVAAGLGIALTLSDLMAWFAWGARDTTGFVVVSYFVAVAVTVVCALGILAAIAEYVDTPDEERGLARLDIVGSLVAAILYGGSAAVRASDLQAAAAGPAPFLLAIAALLVVVADAAVAANLYSAREWEELEEAPRERHPRRRLARG
jgi:uncharacterized membrane protein YidH (DUF202 family)